MWRKLDFHFAPNGVQSWARSHATVPTPLSLGGARFRIFYCTRDDLARNSVGYVDVEIGATVKVLQEASRPVLGLGRTGYFDCDGVYATCLVRNGEQLHFYYAGWNAGMRGLFYSSIGLAISTDGGETFQRWSEAPILGRDSVDPWSCMAPFVMRWSATDWTMWYASGILLEHDAAGVLHSKYDIKTAHSGDGLHWTKSRQTAIALGDLDTNIARACVIPSDGAVLRAWYPYVRRSLNQYRIGYAESRDRGRRFERMDDSPWADVRVSGDEQAWDGLAVTYPHVFAHDERLYLLYNGNQFGKTGFGMSVWEP